MNIIHFFGEMSPYYNSYYYNNGTSSMSDSAAIGMLLFVMLFALVFGIAMYIIFALLMGRIFKKAGVESWKAWVPVYNNWVLLELGGQQGFWAVLALVPVVNIVSAVFIYIAMHNIGLKLGKEGAFVLLAIFLPVVWLIWLAVDSSTWEGKQKQKAAQAHEEA
ncbi:MAG TPA: DUF5684 domain-containing protein [Candidatus Chromulinivoraceae bacterium]|nr:DUF5684 domain-containing protein [Candidatus Chromulinivoraceae bacterium]